MKTRSPVVMCCVLLSAGVMCAQSRNVEAAPISGNWESDGVTLTKK